MLFAFDRSVVTGKPASNESLFRHVRSFHPTVQLGPVVSMLTMNSAPILKVLNLEVTGLRIRVAPANPKRCHLPLALEFWNVVVTVIAAVILCTVCTPVDAKVMQRVACAFDPTVLAQLTVRDHVGSMSFKLIVLPALTGHSECGADDLHLEICGIVTVPTDNPLPARSSLGWRLQFGLNSEDRRTPGGIPLFRSI